MLSFWLCCRFRDAVDLAVRSFPLSVLKAVFGLPRLTPTVVLHDKAKPDMIEKRREKHVLLQVHKRAKVRDYLDIRDIGTTRLMSLHKPHKCG